MPIPPMRPKLPPVKSAPVRPPPPANRPAPEADAETAAAPKAGFLTFGAKAKAAVRASMESSHDGIREFFITKKEMEAAKARGETGVTVRVHFIRNYASPDAQVCVSRVSVLEGGNWKQYTTGGEDCALLAAGCFPTIKPVYLLVDHRKFERQDKTCSQDEVKLFVPVSNFTGLMENAVKDLAENLGIPVEDVDITKYEAKITKIGQGRGSTWTLVFTPRPTQLSKMALDNIKATIKGGNSFAESVNLCLAKWLAPSPRYLISKGGTYVRPARSSGGSSHVADDETGIPE